MSYQRMDQETAFKKYAGAKKKEANSLPLALRRSEKVEIGHCSHAYRGCDQQCLIRNDEWL